MIHIFPGRALLSRIGVADYKITVANTKHRPYPQGAVPRDMLSQYLAADGSDMKGLIDEQDLDGEKFDHWHELEKEFMHTKAICTVPMYFLHGEIIKSTTNCIHWRVVAYQGYSNAVDYSSHVKRPWSEYLQNRP